MKLRRVAALAMAGVMAASLAACGKTDDGNKDKPAENSQGGDSSEVSDSGIIEYADLDLDKDCKDLTAEINFSSNRTDLDADDYAGKNWKAYIEDFNKLYPNIKVNVNTITDYDQSLQTYLQSGEYDEVVCVPTVDKADLGEYFRSYGSYDTISQTINYADNTMYDNEVYGIPSTANASGVVYNKKVFEQAGITELPKTPSEFIDALKKIKENCKGVDPLYTNYAAGWALSGQWDGFIGLAATGDPEYKNQKLVHTKDPFRDYGDDTHAYAVYKILYDAVKEGLTEDDYMTTDWEGSKPRMNNGEIGCMVLGSWALPQMKIAGDNPDDVGYMAFPITVDGKQYAAASADRGYGIKKDLDDNTTQAALIFVKWLVERSQYAYNEFSLPVVKGADTQLSFDNVELLQDEPVKEGEEDYLNMINSTSEVNIDQDGDGVRLQRIIEAAATGSESYDDIVADWNQKWNDAMDAEGIEALE